MSIWYANATHFLSSRHLSFYLFMYLLFAAGKKNADFKYNPLLHPDLGEALNASSFLLLPGS